MTLQIRKYVLRFFNSLLNIDSAPGLILVICAILALLLANSAWSESYFQLLSTKILDLSLHHWINDGLMAIFFFVIGMEIKKELLVGHLSSFKKAALPIAAALGGMVVPALIYLYYNPHQPNLNGWGIPMATDIAFALGVLTLFGNRVPLSLKIFLLALAVVDDLGAVLVIAIFYTKEIRGSGLILAGLMLSLIYLIRVIGIKNYLVYTLIGSVVWFGVYYSGVHSTIAGVLLGFMTPLRFPAMPKSLKSYSPLDNLMTWLHPWVNFGIMPLFALANAGIVLTGVDITDVFFHPIYQGVFWGLVLGKPLGIILFSFVSILLGITELPDDLKWKNIIGVAFLGGIGFTVAIFISTLSLDQEQNIFSKMAILLGSIAAATIGGIILKITLNKAEPQHLKVVINNV